MNMTEKLPSAPYSDLRLLPSDEGVLLWILRVIDGKPVGSIFSRDSDDYHLVRLSDSLTIPASPVVGARGVCLLACSLEEWEDGSWAVEPEEVLVVSGSGDVLRRGSSRLTRHLCVVTIHRLCDNGDIVCTVADCGGVDSAQYWVCRLNDKFELVQKETQLGNTSY